MIYRKIYVSTATAGVGLTDLRQILDASRRNNTQRGITGLLLFHEGQFFQVLEGNETAVRRCYDLIARDPRHTDVRPVTAGPVQARAFPNWSMGHIEPERLQPAVRDSVFAIADLVPRDSEKRGIEAEVRNAVRRFLAQFKRLAA